MTDTPSRPEIEARLEAAEARTETRFAELRGDMDIRFARIESQIDKLIGKLDQSLGESRKAREMIASESRSTRATMIVTGLAAVLAVLALVLGLWQAGLSSQANMLAAFQAGIAAPGTPAPNTEPLPQSTTE